MLGDVERVESVNTVGVRTADGAASWFPERREVETRRIDEKLYLLDGLPPGRLVVFADAVPRRFEGEVAVVAGETVELSLE